MELSFNLENIDLREFWGVNNKNFKFLGTLPERQQQVANGVTFSIGKFIRDSIKKHLIKSHQLCIV